MIVGTPRPSSPTRQASAASNSTSPEARDRVPSLSFSRSDPEALVAGAVGEPSWQQEAGQPARRLGQDQERVAHRMRAEPLVAGQLVRPTASTGSARVVLARTSEPPCFSVMAIPQSAAVSGSTDVSRGSHSAASDGSCRSAGMRRIRHGQRAAHAGFGLGQQVQQRPADHVPARRGRAPRPRVDAGGDPQTQQRCPGRMDVDLVDPMRRTGRGSAAPAGCGRRPAPMPAGARRRPNGRTREARRGPCRRPRERPLRGAQCPVRTGRSRPAAAAGSSRRASASGGAGRPGTSPRAYPSGGSASVSVGVVQKWNGHHGAWSVANILSATSRDPARSSRMRPASASVRHPVPPR